VTILGSSRTGAGDPYLGCSFLVEIKGVISAGFSEVSGLSAQVETFDYREGGVNDYLHRVAGPVSYQSNLVLRRGLTTSADLWQWSDAARRGAILRQAVVIVLADGMGAAVWTWAFRDAYPVRWVGPDLRATTNAVAIETLELAHRGLEPSVSGPVA
jgi:phage tail-like protein